ncbi:MAG: hypothetical protein ACRCY4_09465 [Brevinema sp.]
MDGRLYSRPAFISQGEYSLSSEQEKILHTAVENQHIIIVSNTHIRIFDKAYKRVLAQDLPKKTSTYAGGTHYQNAYVVTTQYDGFAVIFCPIGGAPTVTLTASINAPVPYTTNSKTIGARAISAFSQYLMLGNLVIETQGTTQPIEESYIIYSKLSQTAAQSPILPVVINEQTFEMNYPLVLAAQGVLVDLEWASNQLIASFSCGESYVLQTIPSVLIPFTSRKISSKLGSIGENCTVAFENNAYVLANQSIAIISQSGNVQRIGDHIRTYITRRNDIPISSCVNTSMQSIMWVFSSLAMGSSGRHEILCLNFFNHAISILGVPFPRIVRSILSGPDCKDTIVLIQDRSFIHFCLMDEYRGQDHIEVDIPIEHYILSQTTPEERKGSGTANWDVHTLDLVVTGTDCDKLTITAHKKIYNATANSPYLWDSSCADIKMDCRVNNTTCTNYSTTFPISQTNTGVFVGIEIISQNRFTIEYATVEQVLVKG